CQSVVDLSIHSRSNLTTALLHHARLAVAGRDGDGPASGAAGVGRDCVVDHSVTYSARGRIDRDPAVACYRVPPTRLIVGCDCEATRAAAGGEVRAGRVDRVDAPRVLGDRESLAADIDGTRALGTGVCSYGVTDRTRAAA